MPHDKAVNVKLYTLGQSPWVMSLGGLCKLNEDNLQRKSERKKASYLLNYLFVPDKTFRFVLSLHIAQNHPRALGVYSFTYFTDEACLQNKNNLTKKKVKKDAIIVYRCRLPDLG